VVHPRRRGLHRDSHVGHHVRRDCTLRHVKQSKCNKLAGRCGERPMIRARVAAEHWTSVGRVVVSCEVGQLLLSASRITKHGMKRK
jgi:hypothetical protein